jgi:hypothetical protein
MSNETPLTLNVDRAALRRFVDAVCHGAPLSRRRQEIERELLDEGRLTLAQLSLYRTYLAEARAKALITENEHETLSRWLTSVIERAIMPRTSADALHKQSAAVRFTRC